MTSSVACSMSPRVRQRGVVDQDVERAETLDREGDQATARGRVGQVGAMPVPFPARLGDGRQRLPCRRLVAPVHDDARAERRQAHRDATPDAGGGTGDDGDFARQASTSANLYHNHDGAMTRAANREPTEPVNP